ncbi:MAG: hypothetical protein CL836_08290, partial [Crocinitomicaceae bacterium]|nr:hypothetical protein [Crocinitomicaceae bacterium]
MWKCLFVFVLFFSFQLNHSQSYNTVTFNGDVSVFNDAERKWVGNGTRYFITYDENYIYALANRNSSAFGTHDHFTIYFDTDPQSDVTTSGNGSTSGLNWDNNTPTLPIKADYRVAIRRNNSESWLHHYDGSSWVDQSVDYTEWVNDNNLFIRIPIADLGNPDAIYFVAYMSWGSGGSGGFFGADNAGYAISISGSTILGYYGGIGLLSSGATMWSNANTPILGSSTDPTVGGKYAKVALSSTNSNVDASSANFEIIEGGQLTIDKASSMTITGGNFKNYGSATMESDSNEFSSLIISGGSNTGSITYNRWINGVSSASPSSSDPGWDLVGSPMTNGTLTASNLATDGTNYAIQPYDNTDNTWNATTDGGTFTTTTGVGYSMAKTTAGTVGFTGVPNHKGEFNIALTENMSEGGSGDRWNLIANPYPAYIALNNAAKEASSATGSLLWYNAVSVDVLGYTDSEEGIWYWDGDSYETANNGSTALWAAPGQAFFVSSPVGGSTFSFRPGNLTTQASIVSGGSGTGDDFISGDMMEDNRGELFISLNQNDFERRTQVYFLEDAYDNLDSGYDTRTFPMNDNATSVFTRLVEGDQGVDLSIQSLAYSEMWDKVIPLGINALGGEEMTISISHRTTPADLNIYLEDTEEGTMTNLLDGDYVLTPASDLSGVGRFFIHMTADTMSNGEVSTSMLNAYKEIDASYITIEGLATQSNETKVSL